ncbi:hypothetical protein FOL47_008155 [Perkinsus chesapeaki]|uniref:Uncharacterized protein n=1 Tax=Perkinsus chesapeaki TaxID=330153 RepID=A0A7J6LFQ1_PERCH|nr:hypothetical protein FOL47_008155 [Perkinsus chesapeaki]
MKPSPVTSESLLSDDFLHRTREYLTRRDEALAREMPQSSSSPSYTFDASPIRRSYATPLKIGAAHERMKGSALLGGDTSDPPLWPRGSMTANIASETDAALVSALRKSQNRCQELLLSKEELSGQLTDVSQELTRVTEEKQRVDHEVDHLRQESHRLRLDLAEAQKKGTQADRELRELRHHSEKDGVLSKERVAELQTRCDAQQARIRDLEVELRNIASESTASRADLHQTASAVVELMMERSTIEGFLVEALSALQSMYQDPRVVEQDGVIGPLRQTRQTPTRGKSARPMTRAGVPSTGQSQSLYNAGTAELIDLITQLECELAEISIDFTSMITRIRQDQDLIEEALAGLDDCPSLADRVNFARNCTDRFRSKMLNLDDSGASGLMASRSKSPHGTRRGQRNGFVQEGLVQWMDERNIFVNCTKSLDAKLDQLQKLRRVLRARIDARQSKVKPLWS